MSYLHRRAMFPLSWWWWLLLLIITLPATNGPCVCVCVTPQQQPKKNKIKYNFCAQPSDWFVPVQMEWMMMMIFRSVPAALHEIAFCVFFLLLLLLLLFGSTSFLSLSLSFLSLVPRKITRHSQWKRNSSMGWNGNKRKKKRRKKQSGNNSLVSFLFL